MFTVGLATIMAVGLCACGSQKAAEITATPAVAETTAAPSQDEKKEEAKETIETQASSETAGGEGYVMVLCDYSIGNSWGAQMEQEFMVGAEKLKAEGVVNKYYITNSSEDINEQVSGMQDLTTKKVNAIVIMAASPTALASVVGEAAEAGIKVVPFDNVVEADEQMAMTGVDEEEFGRIGTEWLANKLGGKGKIVILNGIVGAATNSLRWGGAEKVFKQYPSVEIPGSANASWDYAQGRIAMESMLPACLEIDSVWSQGDAMAQGAIDTFIAAGRDLVPMTSEGNNDAIRVWIENKGKGLSCIAPSNPTYTSTKALRIVIGVLNGEGIPGSVVVDIKAVTEENVDQYCCSDMPDSFWVLTELDSATLQEPYKQLARFGNDGQTDEYRPALHIRAMSVPEEERG